MRSILDAHYLYRDPALAESAIRKLETGTKATNRAPNCLKMFRTQKEVKFSDFKLAGGLGFEPRLAESESAVLPLNYPPRDQVPDFVGRPRVGRGAKAVAEKAQARFR